MKEKRYQILSSIVICFILAFFCALCFYSPSLSAASNNVINGCIYAGNIESKKVSFMINVYWGTEYIEPILDVLDDYDVKLTFFVGGTWAKDNPDMLKKIYNAGHEIASHGYSHKEHKYLSLNQNLEEMQKTHNIVKEIIGYDITLFAPPGGSYNSDTVKAAESLGYSCIMWTRDTIDWRDHNTELIYNRAIKGLSGGDLVLMHPKEKTLEALPRIIDYAIKAGFKVTTVSDTIS